MMKKGILILTLLVFATITTMMMVPPAKAATVTIHDNAVKPKDECDEVINGADGKAGPWSGVGGYIKQGAPNYNIWLYGDNDAWVLVNSTIESNVIYIQYHSSDDNDGYTYIYVDDVLVSSDINTYMKGSWYVEIQNLPMGKHTVKVGAFGPDAEPGVPGVQDDNDVWYFCFCLRVGGIAVPIDKFGLLAPYIGLASMLVATVATAIYVQHVKRRKEK